MFFNFGLENSEPFKIPFKKTDIIFKKLIKISEIVKKNKKGTVFWVALVPLGSIYRLTGMSIGTAFSCFGGRSLHFLTPIVRQKVLKIVILVPYRS